MEREYKLFPEIEPFNTGYLKVSDIHTIYYEEVGDPEGKPIVFLHGGPGAGISPDSRRFFDPEFYRIILFEQRGCGRSTPHAETKENTTWDLIEDIEKLRSLFNIEEWIVFGGSWGSTLSLIYAINYPERVKALILRGIWLSREEEILWTFGGGASRFFPEVWEKFLEPVGESKGKNLVEEYYKIFTQGSKKEQIEAAKAWSFWESSIVKLIPSEEIIEKSTEEEHAVAIAKLECHYFANNMFGKKENYILDNIEEIKDIPAFIVNGRYDVICPPYTAKQLHDSLNNSEFVVVDDAGHSTAEEGIIHELVKSTEKYKYVYK
ncbi:MAG: prolyl aminopeptidase [Bacillota bacterium]|nr:prolyl aminopeptidase [Bacillota bacterium]